MGVFSTMFSPQEVQVQGTVAEGFQGVRAGDWWLPASPGEGGVPATISTRGGTVGTSVRLLEGGAGEENV